MQFSTIKNAIVFFFTDNYRFRCALLDRLRQSGALNWLNDTAFIKLTYFVFFQRRINLKTPRTFNEKLNWLKLNDRNALYSRLVDKYEVKQYIQEHTNGRYIIKNYGVWNSFDEIDFCKLPQKFVLKCTHDSGSVVICKNKDELDLEKAKEKINKGLRKNLYYWGREWPYKMVKPRVLAEECLEDNTDNDLKDYKFFCFNGKVKCFKVDFGRFSNHRANYYDLNGKLLNIGEVICPPDPNHEIVLPDNLEEMIGLAEELSKEFAFLRVDLYSIRDAIFFGELTFYPASALSPFIDFNSDVVLGEYLSLPNTLK